MLDTFVSIFYYIYHNKIKEYELMKKNSSIIIFFSQRILTFRILLPLFAVSLFFFLVSAMLFISNRVLTSPVGWERQSIISPKGVVAHNVSADQRGNLVACVFESSKSGTSTIHLAISFNGGKSFLKPRGVVQFKSKIRNNPKIAIDKNGKLYLCWYTLSSDGANGRMFLKTSADYGVTWTKKRIISFNMKMSILPSVYCDPMNRIHLFFTASKGRVFNLFHSIMNEKGSFRTPEKITELKGGVKGAFFPAVKFYKNRAVVIWQSKERDFKDHLYIITSGDYGDSWSGIDKITTGRFNNQSPSFVIFEDTIYLAYMNNRKKNWEIELLKGRNYGIRWEGPFPISQTNANCYSPDIILGSDRDLLITWHDSREKENLIFYRKVSMRGTAEEGVKKLSVQKRSGTNPVLIKSSDGILVLWEEGGRIVINRSDTSVSSPFVFSPTHRNEAWTKDRSAIVKWTKPKDESGIAGYAVLVDKKPKTQPTIQNYRYDQRQVTLDDLGDGITYFHVRAIDGAGNMSRTVHYKLQVSANPLPMPVIVSSTHPEGGRSDKREADFRWAVSDSRRLKAFLYSLSKEKFSTPNRLLDDFKISFNNLEPGVYFFNLAAISKTNQVSKVATYSFIVGKSGKLDPEYIKKIAERKDIFRRSEVVKDLIPKVRILFPHDENGICDKNDFDVYVKVSNIPSKMVSSFAVVLDKGKIPVPRKENSVNPIFNFKNLDMGDYWVGVRAKYFIIKDGKKSYRWTRPSYRQVKITVPLFRNPFDSLYEKMIKLTNGQLVLVLGFLSLLIAIPLFLWHGERIVFYLKLARYRLHL